MSNTQLCLEVVHLRVSNLIGIEELGGGVSSSSLLSIVDDATVCCIINSVL